MLELYDAHKKEPKRDDVIMGSNLSSPLQLFGTNKKFQENMNPFLTPQTDTQDGIIRKSHQYRNNVNTVSTDHTKQRASIISLPSAFNSMVIVIFPKTLFNRFFSCKTFKIRSKSILLS